MYAWCFQAVDPRPINEEEEEANKKTFGEEYVRRVPTHFRGYTIDDDGKKTPVVRLEVATPRNSFTPFFFFIMELILKTLGIMETVEAILDGMESYEEIRTLKVKYVTPNGSKIEEDVFGVKFLATLNWVMYCTGSVQTTSKGGYAGNDGGETWKEIMTSLKVVQKDDEGKEYNPWVDAFQDEWIAVLNARAKERKRSAVMADGIDADDIV